MDSHDVLSVSDVSRRSGFAASALRYYESQGLIVASRTGGGQRRYQRGVLRRLAFIRAGGQRRADPGGDPRRAGPPALVAHPHQGGLATDLALLARPAGRADRGPGEAP